jgi:dihydrofolate reductase
VAGDQGADRGLSASWPEVFLIAAVARNGVIGAGNRLLWRLSTDLRRFRETTLGKPVLMGRKTYVSIGKPLPGRETVVVTRDRGFAAPGVFVAHTVDEALALATKRAAALGAQAIAVAGGGEIYAAMLPMADRLILTEVDLAPEGDAFFPTIDPNEWRESRREAGLRGAKDEAEFAFVEYERELAAPTGVAR